MIPNIQNLKGNQNEETLLYYKTIRLLRILYTTPKWFSSQERVGLSLLPIDQVTIQTTAQNLCSWGFYPMHQNALSLSLPFRESESQTMVVFKIKIKRGTEQEVKTFPTHLSIYQNCCSRAGLSMNRKGKWATREYKKVCREVWEVLDNSSYSSPGRRSAT